MRTLVFYTEIESTLPVEKLSKILKEAGRYGFGKVCLVIDADPPQSYFENLISAISKNNYLLELVVPFFFDIERGLDFLKGQNFSRITFKVFGDQGNYFLNSEILKKFVKIKKKLKDFGIDFGVHYILTHQNVSQILNIIKVFNIIQPDFVKFQEAWPTKENIKNNSLLEPGDLEYYLSAIRNHHQNFSVEVTGNFQRDNFYDFIQGKEIIIEPKGVVRLFPFSEMPVLANIFESNFEEILNRLRDGYNFLMKKASLSGEFLNWNWYFKNYFPEQSFLQPKKRALMLELTSQCGLNCIFCPQKSKKDINFNLLSNILSQKNKIDSSIDSFELGGAGDPLLYKKIKDVIKILSQYDKRVTVITNGFDLKKKLLKLGDVSLEKISFCIYLDSPNPPTNDFLMGKRKAFKKTIESIEYLIEKNIKFSIFMRITPQNYNEMTMMTTLCRHYFCSMVAPLEIFPLGKADEGTLLSDQIKTSVLESIANLKNSGAPILKNIHFELPSENCSYLRKERIFINSEGKLAFCHFLSSVAKTAIKEIKGADLTEIIKTNDKIRDNFLEKKSEMLKNWIIPRKKASPCSFCLDYYGIKKKW
jgi:MoaA/NifB/PqqE/SkfB family radical SAM enzyme